MLAGFGSMQSVPYPTAEPVVAMAEGKSSGAPSVGCTSGRCYLILRFHVSYTASF